MAALCRYGYPQTGGDRNLAAFNGTARSILNIAAVRETVGEGALLLAIYSLGLAVPFWIAAAFSGAFMRFLTRFRRHLGLVEKVMGVLLILTGLAFLSGFVSDAAIWFQQTFPILSRIG